MTAALCGNRRFEIPQRGLSDQLPPADMAFRGADKVFKLDVAGAQQRCLFRAELAVLFALGHFVEKPLAVTTVHLRGAPHDRLDRATAIMYNGPIGDVPTRNSFEVVNVARKAPPESVDNAVADYVAGESCEVCARRHRVSESRLRGILRDRGVWRSPAERRKLGSIKLSAARRTRLPDDEIAARYQAGESENSIAKSLGISRGAIRTRLIDAEVPIRGTAEANRLMMAARTPEENRLNTAAAHQAVRGRKSSFDERCRRAKLNEERVAGQVEVERTLSALLAERGIETIPQKAIGPYNVDLGAAPVAVEVFGGTWHLSGRHAARATERFRYILDQGWNVIIVWVDGRRWPLSSDGADDVASFIEQARRDPSTVSKYRVIRGDGEFVTAGESDDDHFALVHPGSRARSGRARN